ncbi:MAG TPA: hypothetical protein VIO94_03285 [Phenylobacterium sp.]
MARIPIAYVSDFLCVWADVSLARVEEVARAFEGQVPIENRFCSAFGHTASWGPARGNP